MDDKVTSHPLISMPQPMQATHLPPTDSDASFPGPPVGNDKPGFQARSINRTPSPTQSELDFLSGVRKKRSTWEIARGLLILVVIIVAIVLIEIYHDQIINALKPVTRWLHGARGGWLVPIAVLIVLSFPPLFGHEVVAMLCGLVWGIGVGFALVAAGTLLGEIGTYYLFRYALRSRAEKYENRKLSYATLAHVIRHGGLPMATVVRYSAFPGHLTTAIFSTCGMAFWVFLVAATLGLGKQLAFVYVGYALNQSDSKSKKIQRIVVGITVAVTVLAMLYVRRKQVQSQDQVVYQRRKARQSRVEGEAMRV
ncbi:unnamed protein product [Mycena citricolor]|uniref:Golgi apparatus membrane protein TVP38 n=1 Tax=Mycena citricolor TaxID=2018698 RepID=A0AAD2K436_9AGAR|nr:unnamed protein product [Mycena citricolor]